MSSRRIWERRSNIDALLSVENLVVAYGAVEALKGVSLQIQEGDIVAVLGANGAGKTTLLKVISGLVPIKSGVVRLMGEDLSKFPPHSLAALGMAHIPEGRRVFATLTVEENLNIGTWGVRNKLSAQQIQETKEWIFSLFPILKTRRKQLAGTLSGGEQQRVAIARAIVNEPPIVLADEPTGNLDTNTGNEIFNLFEELNRAGQTIVVVTHNLSLASRTHRAVNMKDGLIIK